MRVEDITVGFEVPVTLRAVVKKVEDLDGQRKLTLVVRSCAMNSPFEETDVAETTISFCLEDLTGLPIGSLVDMISSAIQRDVGEAVVSSFNRRGE